MSHMQMKDKTNVRFSVHECVMETWHVHCSKNSKHTLFAFEADTCGNKNILITIRRAQLQCDFITYLVTKIIFYKIQDSCAFSAEHPIQVVFLITDACRSQFGGDSYMLVGHSLEEIRVRALQNVLSKLQHNLVCDADLVQEKHLHIRLLEWFNFATCPMQQQVLALVLRMSKVGF